MIRTDCSRCAQYGAVDWAPDTLAVDLPHWRSYTLLCGDCMSVAAGMISGQRTTPLAAERRTLSILVDRVFGGRR